MQQQSYKACSVLICSILIVLISRVCMSPVLLSRWQKRGSENGSSCIYKPSLIKRPLLTGQSLLDVVQALSYYILNLSAEKLSFKVVIRDSMVYREKALWDRSVVKGSLHHSCSGHSYHIAIFAPFMESCTLDACMPRPTNR